MGFGILAMLFATATISSCGEAESTDEKTEVKEGEDGEKCCSEECKAEGKTCTQGAEK